MQMCCFSVILFLIQAFRVSKLRSEIEGKSHFEFRSRKISPKSQSSASSLSVHVVTFSSAGVMRQKEAPPPDGYPGDTGGSINLNITVKKIHDKNQPVIFQRSDFAPVADHQTDLSEFFSVFGAKTCFHQRGRTFPNFPKPASLDVPGTHRPLLVRL